MTTPRRGFIVRPFLSENFRIVEVDLSFESVHDLYRFTAVDPAIAFRKGEQDKRDENGRAYFIQPTFEGCFFDDYPRACLLQMEILNREHQAAFEKYNKLVVDIGVLEEAIGFAVGAYNTRVPEHLKIPVPANFRPKPL